MNNQLPKSRELQKNKYQVKPKPSFIRTQEFNDTIKDLLYFETKSDPYRRRKL